MAIIRNDNREKYTVIDNDIFKNKDLSLQARGMLTTLLSLPNNWEFSENGLEQMFGDSLYKIRQSLNELERLGYLVRKRVRNECGHLKQSEWFIYETPICDLPTLVQPILVQPILVDLPQSNTNISNTNLSNTNLYKKTSKKEKDFEELWKIYPNKKGKTNAYKKYLKTKVDDETIRQGILNYISYIKLKKIQPQFIKHGSTWFNEEAWNDDYSEVVENIEDKKARFEEMMKYR